MRVRTPIGIFCLAVVLASCTREPRERTFDIAFSNNMNGEIRACGCSSNDYGGLGRRATFIARMRQQTDNLILLEGGDLFGVDVNYGNEKADLSLRALQYMGYDGVVLGEQEFGFGVDFVVDRVTALRLPVIMSNVFDTTTGEALFPPSRVVTLPNGLRIGLIGVLGDVKLPPDVEKGRLRVEDPEEAVRREIAALGNVDVIVVLAHGGSREVEELARSIPDIDVIVTGHEGRTPRNVRRSGNAFVLQVGPKGRYIGTARAVVDPEGVVDLTREITPLTIDYVDHESIVKLFQSYDMEVAQHERQRLEERMRIAGKTKRSYTGVAACEPCHAEIVKQWQGTKHAHAFEILEEQNRQFDRDCTPCHTTGFYEIGGFLSVVETPELVGVQCEVCHGSGFDHVEDPTQRTKGDAKAICTSCHNEEQTPDFSFDEEWPLIAH